MAFYFFEPTPSMNMEGLVRLWGVALQLIDIIMELDRKMSLISYWPSLIERAMALTSITILRLSRSSMAPHLDLEAGEKAYFSAIKAFEKASLQPDDLRSRAVKILSQLWTNQDVFKYPDGHIDSLRTRIRSRLSMSIVFDCFLWFKDTALDHFNPFQHEKNAEGSTAEEENNGPDSTMAGPSFNVTTPSSTDQDVIMASIPLTTMSTGAVGDSMPDIHAINDLTAGWMVPDYDWAANFPVSTEPLSSLPSLPSLPWDMRGVNF